ncbi:MAG: 16S rRNA (adenine(1518)-N(6)/adenine(1519)-N(6))-dimethyltransferase RsmA [Moraxellaceae bacterium]|jgi:16S rRNA (adenine1518-N6/adenine1519-N6)-dimethyltransferase|nr:16S rRNA (adenine(1518)-N(6)/adenine(1519)-N(6))-dimethyltransferase RsmA [Moraxellaceae bacterium]MBP7229329.1 16S rRNA (adenine(1518)-N(6)/adenine(1519)-N(6))-dimethyltransferase RsmA [Moraxellaceae bacterium]MBP8851775.1 16S rRNA (adenine(1518)-N(6)/adenine(1519)-N(6))-dimethyltransferase RsmA [Moraxellaceae bacterium]MBP9046078.1 16S rRNA (adenine(1518)-N(6)/adenine(1519)-N(6))-dimethyltransferase RsmA [Moraxellaceae bacterium]MBP9731713.1 16S rRNA (adenine(1518)-N(6)/adenine(1519)-N(6))
MSRRVDGHLARKRFGQNFLTDERIISAIVAAFAPVRGQNVVEIGPGLGAITRELLAHLGKVHVVELDRDLAAALPIRLMNEGELIVHQSDALKFDFRSLATGPHSLRVIGNLPYNISTPILFYLLSQADVIADMTFMLQKEVVERMVAEPGNGDYGRLSVMLQYRCNVEWLLHVPPESFSPAPKVDSAVVRLTPHTTARHSCHDEQRLQQLLTAAFNMRRKTLRNALKGLIPAEWLDEAGIDAGLRPEEVSVTEWVALANRLATQDQGKNDPT